MRIRMERGSGPLPSPSFTARSPNSTKARPSSRRPWAAAQSCSCCRRPTAAPEELSAAVYNLLAIDAVLGLCMAGAGLAGAEWLLRLIRTPAEILPQAAEYIRFYLAGLPFLMVYDLSKQLVMACGNSKTPLYAVLATSVLNVLLDLAWVGPFGVAGAAAATALSQVAGCLFMLWYLRRTLLTGPFRFSMLDRRCLGEVFRLAAPSAIQQASAPVTSMVKIGRASCRERE